MSIHDIVQKIKGGAGERAGILPTLLILAVASVVSFSLGYAARGRPTEASADVVIQCDPRYVKDMSQSSGDTGAAGGSSQVMRQAAPQKAYIASRNGTKYYPAGCAGASRIQEENRIYFDTTEKAVAAGYSLASTCK